MFAEFVFSAGLPMIQGTSPSAQVHRPQSNGASHVTWPPSGGGGDFVPGQQNFKACIFFLQATHRNSLGDLVRPFLHNQNCDEEKGYLKELSTYVCQASQDDGTRWI